tara:strand:- start:314 stop:997 length:684 start_codon:yes stop_codon:yes gene_type:complete
MSIIKIPQRKMFKHTPSDLGYDNLETQEGVKRLYLTPEGKYPSITTVLGSMPKPGLDAWRKRVGEVEANRVSKFASSRGTAVHELLERYVDNEDDFVANAPMHVIANFLEIKKILDEGLTEVWQQECALYSKHLGIAGRVDLVGRWDGKPAIIDYKTSARIKPRKFCYDYFAQEAGYAVMYEERTGQPITQLVTLIAGDEGAQVFVEHRDEWIGRLITAKKHYDSIQ